MLTTQFGESADVVSSVGPALQLGEGTDWLFTHIPLPLSAVSCCSVSHCYGLCPAYLVIKTLGRANPYGQMFIPTWVKGTV